MRNRWRIAGPTAVGCSLLLSALPSASPARAEGGELPVPAWDRLPFAIRDGRIATVSVHTIPFEPGSRELTAPVEAALQRLVETIATDCFLTAQAIGHARPEAEAGGDAVGAQGLAQARSELVKKRLGRAGLPADAVAALSDYRFTVREAGVTLWVFRLIEGEECGGVALARAVDPPAPRPVQPKAAASRASRPVTAPPTPASPEPLPPPAAGAPVASAEILFEPRNSHLPSGAEATLKRFVNGLEKVQGYQFELAATVDGPAPDGAGPDVARRFQRWLAERRLARITEWLQRNAPFRDVRVRGTLVEGAPPGRVVVRAHLLPAQNVTGKPGAPISPREEDGSGKKDGDRDRG